MVHDNRSVDRESHHRDIFTAWLLLEEEGPVASTNTSAFSNVNTAGVVISSAKILER